MQLYGVHRQYIQTIYLIQIFLCFFFNLQYIRLSTANRTISSDFLDRPNIAVSNNENSITCAMQYCFNISIPFTFLKIFLNSFILSLYYHKIIYTFHIYSVSVILMIRQKFSMPIFNHIGIHLFYHLNTYDNNTI